MNDMSRIPFDLVDLHRQAVTRTLVDFLETPGVQPGSSGDAVARFYDSLTVDEKELLLHQEPFDTACNLAGIEGAERQAAFDRVRQSYGAMMEDFDARADLIEPSPGCGAD